MKGKKWKKFKPLFHSTLFQSHYLPPNCDDGFARNPRETKKAKVGPTQANCDEKTSQVHLITVAVLDKQFLFECIIMQKLNIYLSSLRKWKETNYVKLCFDNNLMKIAKWPSRALCEAFHFQKQRQTKQNSHLSIYTYFKRGFLISSCSSNAESSQLNTIWS